MRCVCEGPPQVSELAKELEALQAGADPSLTLRERLWQEKEKEKEQGGEGGEAAAGAAGGGAGEAGGGGGGQPLPRAIPERLQQLLDPERRPAGGLGGGRLEDVVRAAAGDAPAGGAGGGLAAGRAGGSLGATPPRPDPVVAELSEGEVAR